MTIRYSNRLFNLVLLLVLLPASSVAADEGPPGAGEGYQPLSAGQRRLFLSSPEDSPAEKLMATEERLEGRHYVTCDEWNLHLFEPKIRNLAGGFVGVGTDQVYLFLGWQRPHLAWLFDYDPWVVHLHRAYLLFFEKASTPEEFMGFFEKKVRKQTMKLLKERYGDRKDVRELVRVFKFNRDTIQRRLVRVARKLRKAKVPCYLTDQETYDFVRNLILAGRVRPMVGDLLADKGLTGIAAAARELGVPVRVLYMSNAEGYWRYGRQFRANMATLYFDERSLIVRTVAAKWTNGDYRYNLQSALNFRVWLEKEWVKSFKQIVPMGKLKGDGDIPLTYVDRPPPEKAPARGKKKKKRK